MPILGHRVLGPSALAEVGGESPVKARASGLADVGGEVQLLGGAPGGASSRGKPGRSESSGAG